MEYRVESIRPGETEKAQRNGGEARELLEFSWGALSESILAWKWSNWNLHVLLIGVGSGTIIF